MSISDSTFDGPGKTIAYALSTTSHSRPGMPLWSAIVFDSADVPELGPSFEQIALHEDGHAIGWD